MAASGDGMPRTARGGREEALGPSASIRGCHMEDGRHAHISMRPRVTLRLRAHGRCQGIGARGAAAGADGPRSGCSQAVLATQIRTSTSPVGLDLGQRSSGQVHQKSAMKRSRGCCTAPVMRFNWMCHEPDHENLQPDVHGGWEAMSDGMGPSAASARWSGCSQAAPLRSRGGRASGERGTIERRSIQFAEHVAYKYD